MNLSNYKFWSAFNSRTDLKKFEPDSLLLYAIQLKFQIEDIDILAATSLTEGYDDKKADLVYIDTDSRNALIAQTYIAIKLTDKNGHPIKEAPANKASDLNTAASWLLGAQLDQLPIELRSHAAGLRESIMNKEIDKLHIWYVHNLPESENVNRELAVVATTVKDIIKSRYPESDYIDVLPLEVGVTTLERFYISISTPILVDNEFIIETIGGFEISGPDWSAYVTSIPAQWLYEQYSIHKTDLLSADIREYLGSRKSDTNINFRIKETATSDPSHFWVYNNGITALVYEFEEIKSCKKPAIRIKGFSIVNGAQTTGSIGSLKSPPNNVYVQVRFIKCHNAERVHDIVLYNNSQNRVTGPDFRSNDLIQRRLREEFIEIPGIEYIPRRGGFEDIIRRQPNALPSVTAGQALAAFHHDPEIAYHQKTKLWDEDKLYVKYFNEHTTAKHIFFTYSLLKAIEKKKMDLLNGKKNETLTGQQQKQLEFYRMRGSIFLMVSAIGICIDTILGKPIPNSFNLCFKSTFPPQESIEKWTKIIDITSPYVTQLEDGVSDGFRNREIVEKAISNFESMLASSRVANPEVYDEFATDVIF